MRMGDQGSINNDFAPPEGGIPHNAMVTDSGLAAKSCSTVGIAIRTDGKGTTGYRCEATTDPSGCNRQGIQIQFQILLEDREIVVNREYWHTARDRGRLANVQCPLCGY